MKANLNANRQRLTHLVDTIPVPQITIDSKKIEIPNHLDFCKNEAFASNLQTDRKRRLDYWKKSLISIMRPNGQTAAQSDHNYSSCMNG